MILEVSIAHRGSLNHKAVCFVMVFIFPLSEKLSQEMLSQRKRSAELHLCALPYSRHGSVQDPVSGINQAFLVFPRTNIPWSGSKWCWFLGYTDRSTISRLRTESADDIALVLSSCIVHYFWAKHGYASRYIGCIDGVALEDPTTPDRGIFYDPKLHFDRQMRQVNY